MDLRRQAFAKKSVLDSDFSNVTTEIEGYTNQLMSRTEELQSLWNLAYGVTTSPDVKLLTTQRKMVKTVKEELEKRIPELRLSVDISCYSGGYYAFVCLECCNGCASKPCQMENKCTLEITSENCVHYTEVNCTADVQFLYFKSPI